MGKSKITGINKSENHLVFSVEKDENILDNISSFLKEIGFSVTEVNKIFSPLGDSDNNYSLREYSSDIYKDISFFIDSEKIKAMVFFGDKKASAGLVISEKDGNDLQEILDKYFEFS